jgi:hypothetical protein
MSSNLLEESVADILRTVLEDTGDDLLVINPGQTTIEELVSVMKTVDDPPQVRLLAAERPLKDVMDDFIVASTAADLIDEDRLSLRVLGETPENSLLITDQSVVAVVAADHQVAGLVTEDETFVDGASDRYSAAWDGSDTFTLRTPPLTRVRETLTEEIGESAADDFNDVLSSLQTARGNGQGLDEVTISLLVAARNGELLYDISKWGEDIGLASKATFSRTKTKLEDMGLIDTEKVPIDVGRPRLRLMLGDDDLQDAKPAKLADIAERKLTA